MSTPEYQAYLAKVSEYFSANTFEISRDMMVEQYKVDLVGLRMSAGFVGRTERGR